MIIALLAIGLLSALICVPIARKRNLQPVYWGLMAAFVLGPLAIPFVLFGKPARKPPDR